MDRWILSIRRLRQERLDRRWLPSAARDGVVLEMVIDLNHGSGLSLQPRTLTDDVNDAIDAGLMRARALEKRRTYLGMSRYGEPCKRKLCYEYAGEPVDAAREIGPRMLRIFATGHALEKGAADTLGQDDLDPFAGIWRDLSAKWLRDAGFDLMTGTPDGRQFEVIVLDGKSQGHIDGLITRSPILEIPRNTGWEHKGINQKTWNKIRKHGVKLGHEVYHGQVQTYMGFFRLEQFLFTATNKNTSEQYHELVKFDPSCCQRLCDSAYDVIRTVDGGHILPRMASNPDFFLCKMCDRRERCWSDPR